MTPISHSKRGRLFPERGLPHYVAQYNADTAEIQTLTYMLLVRADVPFLFRCCGQLSAHVIHNFATSRSLCTYRRMCSDFLKTNCTVAMKLRIYISVIWGCIPAEALHSDHLLNQTVVKKQNGCGYMSLLHYKYWLRLPGNQDKDR
jgi:hypothetical protein